MEVDGGIAQRMQEAAERLNNGTLSDKCASALEVWEFCTRDQDTRLVAIQAGLITPLLRICTVPKRSVFPVNTGGRSQSDQATEAALGALACISMEEEACQAMMQMGCSGLMLGLLLHPNEAIQESAAGVLTNITSIPGYGVTVARAGAVPVFTKLLGSRSEECREAAAGAIRNIAADTDESKRMIAEHVACIRELVRLLGTGRPKIQLNAVEAIVNLTSDQSCREIVAEQGGIPPLVMLVGLNAGVVDEEVKEMAARALAGLAAEEANRQMIARAGGMKFLSDMLGEEGMSEGPRAGAGMALANLCINAKNRASLAEPGFLGAVASILGTYPRGSPLRESCKMLWLKLDADPALRTALVGFSVDLS